MIYVTHDQVEAMTMGDRICIMHDGAVAQIGPPMEVYLDPASTFVASLPRQPADEPGAGARPPMAGDARRPVAREAARHRATVAFGIRPEDVASDRSHGAWLSGRVASLEPLGAETLVHVDSAFGVPSSCAPAARCRCGGRDPYTEMRARNGAPLRPGYRPRPASEPETT